MTEEKWTPPKPSFERETVYTVEQIAEIAIKYDEPREWGGEPPVYLVADASDGREYWFVADGEGWRVDHTWGLYGLVKE